MSEAALESEPRRPLLAPWYRLVQESDRLLLEHGGSVVTFEGKAAGLLLPKLVPLLDGTRTVDQIVDRLGPAVAPSVRLALGLLEEHGLLLDEPPAAGGGSPGEGAVYAAAVAAERPPPTPSTTAARLGTARVGIAGRARSADDVAGLVRDSGVGDVCRGGVELADSELDLLVVAPERDETTLLRDANLRALAAERAWVQVLPHDGRVVVVGPLFLPGRTGCHECYRLRRAAGSDYEVDFERIESVPGRGAMPRAVVAVAAGLAALLAIRWLATLDPSLPGQAYSIRTRGVLELERHRLLRVPRCPACGTASEALPSPWYKQVAGDA